MVYIFDNIRCVQFFEFDNCMVVMLKDIFVFRRQVLVLGVIVYVCNLFLNGEEVKAREREIESKSGKMLFVGEFQ